MSQRLSKFFPLFLIAIAIMGVSLRLIDYDRLPPFGETMDEFHYAWAGLTWITTGTPRSWSWLKSYSNMQLNHIWGREFPLVSPNLEKPPLFSLISGSWLYLLGVREIFNVRLTALRILPILLSSLSIIIIGVIGKRLFSSLTGILAALLYSVTPTIIMTNRLALSENLLTPLALFTLLLLTFQPQTNRYKIWQAILVGIGSGLSLLTKQTGLAVLLASLTIYAGWKNWRNLSLTLVIALIIGSLFPLLGFLYNWQLFTNLMAELRQAYNGGLPEFLISLFRSPLIGCPGCTFTDETMLAGYILLFSSPWWLNSKTGNQSFNTKSLVLAFPFLYTLVLALIQTRPVHGWYLYPLFPFGSLLLAHVLAVLWDNFSLYQSLLVVLLLGSGTVRLFLQLNQTLIKWWQLSLFVVTGLMLSHVIIRNKVYYKVIFGMLFVIYLLVNIYTDWNLAKIYPVLSQPLF